MKIQDSGEWQNPGHTIRLPDKEVVPIIFSLYVGPGGTYHGHHTYWKNYGLQASW